MSVLECPVCGKEMGNVADRTDGHRFEWVGNGWVLHCPVEKIVVTPLSHCAVTGLEVK